MPDRVFCGVSALALCWLDSVPPCPPATDRKRYPKMPASAWLRPGVRCGRGCGAAGSGCGWGEPGEDPRTSRFRWAADWRAIKATTTIDKRCAEGEREVEVEQTRPCPFIKRHMGSELLEHRRPRLWVGHGTPCSRRSNHTTPWPWACSSVHPSRTGRAALNGALIHRARVRPIVIGCS